MTVIILRILNHSTHSTWFHPLSQPSSSLSYILRVCRLLVQNGTVGGAPYFRTSGVSETDWSWERLRTLVRECNCIIYVVVLPFSEFTFDCMFSFSQRVTFSVPLFHAVFICLVHSVGCLFLCLSYCTYYLSN